MDTNNLPVHPATGLRALGVLPSGRIVWPVLGGDGTGDGDTDQTTDTNDRADGHTDGGEQNEDQGDDGDVEPEGADQLGDPGKKALASQKQKWKAERDRRRELEKQLAEATKPKGDEPTPDQIRADAEQAATAKANARIIRAELKAAAAGKLADPSDVAVFLDPSEFEVDDTGEVDADEISEAITDLLTRKPHLAAGEKRRFQGGGDGGAGRGSKPRTLDQQIAEAEASGDLGRSLRLKQAKLAEARKTNK